MKKLMIMLSAIALAIGVQAASVDWKVSGTSDTSGYTVYLLTDLASSYESVSALASTAVASGTIVSAGRGAYAANGTATSDAITSASMANAYWVIVSSTDATSYNYVKTDMSAMVYDADNQQSSPGTFNGVSAADILAGTSANFAAVPEPTSGILMLVGLAGLALRRRRT